MPNSLYVNTGDLTPVLTPENQVLTHCGFPWRSFFHSVFHDENPSHLFQSHFHFSNVQHFPPFLSEIQFTSYLPISLHELESFCSSVFPSSDNSLTDFKNSHQAFNHNSNCSMTSERPGEYAPSVGDISCCLPQLFFLWHDLSVRQLLTQACHPMGRDSWANYWHASHPGITKPKLPPVL